MNDDMVAARAAYPERIRWFASLPWQYPELALPGAGPRAPRRRLGVMVLANITQPLTDRRSTPSGQRSTRSHCRAVHPTAPPGVGRDGHDALPAHGVDRLHLRTPRLAVARMILTSSCTVRRSSPREINGCREVEVPIGRRELEAHHVHLAPRRGGAVGCPAPGSDFRSIAAQMASNAGSVSGLPSMLRAPSRPRRRRGARGPASAARAPDIATAARRTSGCARIRSAPRRPCRRS